MHQLVISKYQNMKTPSYLRDKSCTNLNTWLNTPESTSSSLILSRSLTGVLPGVCPGIPGVIPPLGVIPAHRRLNSVGYTIKQVGNFITTSMKGGIPPTASEMNILVPY